MDGAYGEAPPSSLHRHHHRHDAATVSILATYILQTGHTRLMVACCCTTLAAHAPHTHLWPCQTHTHTHHRMIGGLMAGGAVSHSFIPRLTHGSRMVSFSSSEQTTHLSSRLARSAA